MRPFVVSVLVGGGFAGTFALSLFVEEPALSLQVLIVLVLLLAFVVTTTVIEYRNNSGTTVTKYKRVQPPLKNEKPLNTTDLNKILTLLEKYQYSGKSYYRLGLSLGLLDHTLDIIKTDNNSSVEHCLREVLTKWLKKADNVEKPSWSTLVVALRSVNQNAVAEGIDRETDPVSMIIENHRHALSQSIQENLMDIARLLSYELEDKSLELLHGSPLEKTEVLLKTVKNAVYENYESIGRFADVLCKFPAVRLIGNDIQKDYTKTIVDDSFEVKIMGRNGDPIKVPLNFSLECKEMRNKWAIAVECAIEVIAVEKQELKIFLQIRTSNSDIWGKVNACHSTGEIMQIIIDHCSLVDLTLLEGIIEHFNIEEAKKHINEYKETMKEFCSRIPLRLLLNETIGCPSSLKCETLQFSVDKSIDERTLKDVQDIIAVAFESLSLNVRAVIIKEEEGPFTITCSFPLALSEPLTKSARKNLKKLKKKGLKKMTIGYSTVYSQDEVKVTPTTKEKLKKLASKILSPLTSTWDTNTCTTDEEKANFAFQLVKMNKDVIDVVDEKEHTEQPMLFTKKAEPLPICEDLLQTISIGNYDDLRMLPVDSNGLLYHCDKYGITLTIPEGAVQEPTTVWFGACLYGDKFDFGDYVPVTPIVWVYINQELMKQAELYLPHHIDATTQSSKSKLALLTANDKTFMFTLNDDTKMEVEAALCKIYCNHFCSHCVGVDKIAYEETDKQCMLAVATKQEDDVTLLVHFCIFPFQTACKKVVEKQYEELGYDLKIYEIFKFKSSYLSLQFEPDKDIFGWERDNDGTYSDNKILEDKVDYNEVIGCKGKKVSKRNIERLKLLEKELIYPPRLRFQFFCTNQSITNKLTKVETTLNGSFPLLKHNIFLKRPCSDSLTFTDLSVTPDEIFDGTDSQLQSDDPILIESLLVVADVAFNEKWFAFGIALKLNESQLRDIEAQNSKAEHCVRHSVMLWRRQNTKASCKPVVDALKAIHFEDAAAQLESQFKEPEGAASVISHTDLPTSTEASALKTETQKLDITQVNDILEVLNLFNPAEWNRLGLALGLYPKTLDILREDRPQDRLTKTIQAWLKCADGVKDKGGATWENLKKAVAATGDNATADTIICK